MVKKIVTLDNLRVPFLTDGKIKILSFRSKNKKANPGVVPDDDVCSKAGITVVKTEFQHNDLSDRGPESIEAKVNAFLDEAEKALNGGRGAPCSAAGSATGLPATGTQS